MTLRVLSYNVHRWGDDRTALARVVRACAPDVMLVQEAPTWFGTRRKRRAMAASFGLRYVAASARNAILVADGIDLVGIRSRRIWRPFVRRRLDFIATQLPGGAVGSVLRVGTSRVAVVVCHLGLHPRGRIHELAQVLDLCRSFNTPYLLAGDLNEEPDGPIWKHLAEEGLTDLGDGPTFNSTNPHKRIDAAQISPTLNGRLLPIPATPDDLAAASDHLPLLIELNGDGTTSCG
ncbi:endonuclease/exonuclease/phosphatase family protein [Kribbella jejuensis]|uniref:Endonuclease/exonuclease/phosphatase family metal-dependent hydrolase n=1 Tax=Kribbella jejuensis TaxID=236068 RepID=A0A542DAF2_9ACTN|nr:endonuclease/exonuclease/phosphatase family protein [Kribbella jejuensis]TQJ00052.1 endonuclease/exonuclease/phosphatase family metal-dependent hydrolase [Kribbella jejuensis]